MREQTYSGSNGGARPPRDIRVLSVTELRTKPMPRWRIRNVLLEVGLSVVFGASGAGKTYAVLDMALAISRGLPWMGHRVRQGTVVYVAAEGALRLRLEAYMAFHGLQDGDLDNFAIVEQAINLLDDTESGGDLDELLASIREACVLRGWESVALVVVDTLNRAMAGGNENSSEDMGLMVESAKAIEEAFNCAMLYVHHAGKDESKGSRGHSSLKAATDTEISIKGTSDTPRVIHLEKLREGESGIDLGAFDLERVDLGLARIHDPDADADERIWSCVVVPCDVPVDSGLHELNQNTKRVYGVLYDLHDAEAKRLESRGVASIAAEIPRNLWREGVMNVRLWQEWDRRKFDGAVRTLKNRGLVNQRGDSNFVPTAGAIDAE